MKYPLNFQNASLLGLVLFAVLLMEFTVLILTGVGIEAGTYYLFYGTQYLAVPIVVAAVSKFYYNSDPFGPLKGLILGAHFMIIVIILDLIILNPLLVQNYSWFLQPEQIFGFLEIPATTALFGYYMERFHKGKRVEYEQRKEETIGIGERLMQKAIPKEKLMKEEKAESESLYDYKPAYKKPVKLIKEKPKKVREEEPEEDSLAILREEIDKETEDDSLTLEKAEMEKDISSKTEDGPLKELKEEIKKELREKLKEKPKVETDTEEKEEKTLLKKVKPARKKKKKKESAMDDPIIEESKVK